MIMKSIIEGMELFDFFAAGHQQQTKQIQSSLWEWEDWFVCLCCGLAAQENEWARRKRNEISFNLSGFTSRGGAKGANKEKEMKFLWICWAGERGWVGCSFLFGGLWAGPGPMAPPKREDSNKQPNQQQREWRNKWN